MQHVYEKTDKFSQDLEVGDEIEVGDLCMRIDKIVINKKDELVLHLTIVGATVKLRSKSMLIIPKKVPITTVK